MGTITQIKNASGKTTYRAQVRIMKDGKTVYSESKTFERKPAATAWLRNKEVELAKPGALDKNKVEDPTIQKVIERYLSEIQRDIGRTKRQVLKSIAASDFAQIKCSEVTSADILAYAKSLGTLPQTVNNYLSHLASVFSLARPAWGYPLDMQVMADARTVGKKLAITGRSYQRDRRPTLQELDMLLEYFGHYELKNPNKAMPMRHIIVFALFSARRQEEITRIQWEDLNEAKSTIIVRDMKHPGEKIGNDVRVELPPEALKIILKQPKKDACIFPYNSKTISSYFTRACIVLGVEDLHFHDLRHEGVSRLFEQGRTIPQVASVSGHRTWTSLQRYSHIEQEGDKYAGWRWLKELGLN